MEITTEWRTVVPGCCNGSFAVPVEVYNSWLSSHENWHCPHCGAIRHFAGESDVTKFKRLYHQKRDCCENLQEVVGLRERQIIGHKGAAGLIRKQRDDARAELAEQQGVPE